MTTDSADANPYRLPRTVIPSRYDLVLEPDLDEARFDGEVAITVEVVESTDTLVLNAAELELHEVTVSTAGGEVAADIDLDAVTERATFTVPSAVPVGEATIRCRFSGILNDKLRGFYRSTFSDDDGVEHTLATTQFESTNARRAFPCFDEPDLKAVFAVSLVVDDDLTTVSCGALTASEPVDGGRRRDTFADTMVMSTYLLAFIVGRLEATDPVDVDGVPLRVVHVPGRGELTAFPLEAGEFCLRWLVDYYGIDYPSDKLDLVAVPDFAFGAMENLGCITFRESLLLADPASATQGELLLIVDVIAHEIAHMWFGDLVTMKWWNGIWLKEAFATFMQVRTTDAFRPEWHRWEAFALERGAAFDTDALANTRPIEFPVVSPADAEGMYDVLTYEKGAAVVRMLEQFLGEDEFRRGVNHYLETYLYANTETTDLWDALEEATGVAVRAAMDSWIFQGGHPIIDVEATDTGIAVTQRRFAYLDADPTSWHVPLIVRGAVDGTVTEARHLLTGDGADIDLGGRPDWVVVNAGGHGFYRVRYDGELAGAVAAVALDVLEPTERYGLVNDTWAAVLAGDADASAFVDLVTALDAEHDLSVWRLMLAGLSQLHAVADADGREALSSLVRHLTTTALGILGYEPIAGEAPTDRELRAVLFQHAGALGNDAGVAARSRELLELTVAGEVVDPDLAAAAVRVVAAIGTDEDYEVFVEQFRSADTPQAELRFLYALVDFGDVELLNRTLEMARSEVRSQNGHFVLSAAMRHIDHGAVAWAFVRDNWDELLDRFPENGIPRLVGGVRALSDPDVVADVERFFADHEVPQGELMVAQHLDKMRVTAALAAREAHRLA